MHGTAHAHEASSTGFGSVASWFSMGGDGGAPSTMVHHHPEASHSGALPMHRSGAPDHAESSGGGMSPEPTPRARLYTTPVPRAAQRGAHTLPLLSSRRRGAGYGWEAQHGWAQQPHAPLEHASADLEGTTDAEERGESHDGASEPSTVEGSHSHGERAARCCFCVLCAGLVWVCSGGMFAGVFTGMSAALLQWRGGEGWSSHALGQVPK